MSEYTPEPWNVDGLTVFGRTGNEPGKYLRPPETPVWVAQMISGTPSAQDFGNAKRLADCVNACGGFSRVDGAWVKTHERIEDPRLEIAALSSKAKSLELLMDTFRKLGDHTGKPNQEVEALLDAVSQNKVLREAVRVLAHDRVHGVPDMVGATVLANPIAAEAVRAARAG